MPRRRATQTQERFPWASMVGPMGRKVPARERTVCDRPQTQIKLAAYAAYLPEWLRILGQTRGVQHLFVLDLFAGPGEYRDGVAGSPVISADAALVVQSDLEERGRPITVHLRLVEKDDKTRRLLAAAMARYDGRVDYQILDRSASERVTQLLDESRGAPTLALLDPDGLEVPFDLVGQFGHRKYTEVLLSFDVQALLRCAEIGDGPAVSRFFGDDLSWRRCYAPSGGLDVDAALELYRRTLARDRLFPYTTLHRIVFTGTHANRAVAQGCGSPKGTEKWLAAFKAAARSFDARLVEVASQLERRAAINRGIQELRAFAGARNVGYAAIYQELLGLNLDERDVHQVLLFLRQRGIVEWTSRLHRDADPAPKFSFVGGFPGGISWDGEERATELPSPRVVWGRQSS